jgi:hypothetical protein
VYGECVHCTIRVSPSAFLIYFFFLHRQADSPGTILFVVRYLAP